MLNVIYYMYKVDGLRLTVGVCYEGTDKSLAL
jgi:hypothetical protein